MIYKALASFKKSFVLACISWFRAATYRFGLGVGAPGHELTSAILFGDGHSSVPGRVAKWLIAVNWRVPFLDPVILRYLSCACAD